MIQTQAHRKFLIKLLRNKLHKKPPEPDDATSRTQVDPGARKAGFCYIEKIEDLEAASK